MTSFSALWLPIVVSVVLVFVASSILHMVLKVHHRDYRRLPDEDELLGEMRRHGLRPGEYVFPYCTDMKEMQSEEMQARYNQGPVGFLTVLPNGMFPVGKSLVLWALYLLLVIFVIAYVASLALPPGAHYRAVFRVVTALALLPFALANLPASIWKGQSWATTARFFVDGIIYALLVAGTFGWLWP